MLRLLPNHAELIRDLCQYDVVGFQTDDDVRSFHSCIEQTAPDSWQLNRDGLDIDGRRMRIGAYPIGVDVDRDRQRSVRPHSPKSLCSA